MRKQSGMAMWGHKNNILKIINDQYYLSLFI